MYLSWVFVMNKIYSDMWNMFKKFITSGTPLLNISASTKYKRMRKDYVYREVLDKQG
jgi:hypothetical protein